MKKNIAFALILMMSIALVKAQVIDTSGYLPPPPRSSAAGLSSILRSQRHLIFFDITQNTWLKTPDGLSTKFISGGFNFNLYYDIPVVKKVFAIAPGIGFSNATVKNNSYLNYFYNNNLQVDSVGFVPMEDSLNAKSKIATDFLDAIVEFRFSIRPDERGKNFWVAPGFRAGFLLSDFWKYKGPDAFGNDVKFKQYSISHLQATHYGVSLRAGYYKFGVFIYYSLSNLFEKDKGPELVPFSAGIAFTPF